MIEIPVPAGELLDRISILRIKRERIADPAKRANVVRELAALEAAAGRHRIHDPGLEAELREVNERLWDVEDALRRLEREGDFSDRFTALARQVYFTNDRRAAIKRRVNLRFDSELIEEKQYVDYGDGDGPRES